jgi:hypothetical protein
MRRFSVSLVGRYYDPTTGQFTSVDPLVDLTDQPYAYTDDDPVNAIDPTGNDFWSNVSASGALRDGVAQAEPSSCTSLAGTGSQRSLLSLESGPVIPSVSQSLLHMREDYIFSAFLAHGYTPQQAAGVLGNLLVESEYTLAPNVASGTGGYGIAQWTDASRLRQLAAFAGGSDNGLAAGDFKIQVQFIFAELESYSYLGNADLRAATTPTAAADAFMNGYEGPGSPHQSRREWWANAMYLIYRKGNL